jgi:hypothetical protein
MSAFHSTEEFREVIDRTFRLMSEDPRLGPRLREAGIPHQYEFTDLGLAVSLRPGTGDEENLVWEWSGEVDFKPEVKLSMSSDTANLYFQGRENIAIAIARHRIRTEGDVRAALALLPLTRALTPRYQAMIAGEYPHLSRPLANGRKAEVDKRDDGE